MSSMARRCLEQLGVGRNGSTVRLAPVVRVARRAPRFASPAVSAPHGPRATRRRRLFSCRAISSTTSDPGAPLSLATRRACSTGRFRRRRATRRLRASPRAPPRCPPRPARRLFLSPRSLPCLSRRASRRCLRSRAESSPSRHLQRKLDVLGGVPGLDAYSRNRCRGRDGRRSPRRGARRASPASR